MSHKLRNVINKTVLEINERNKILQIRLCSTWLPYMKVPGRLFVSLPANYIGLNELNGFPSTLRLKQNIYVINP